MELRDVPELFLVQLLRHFSARAGAGPIAAALFSTKAADLGAERKPHGPDSAAEVCHELQRAHSGALDRDDATDIWICPFTIVRRDAEHIGAKQTQVLQACRRDTVLPPLADGGGPHIAQPSYLSRTPKSVDDLVCVHRQTLLGIPT